MLRLLSRAVLVIASSVVVVPYMTALLSRLLLSHQPLRRAVNSVLHPHRVYAYNLVLLQTLQLWVRYAPLYLRWRRYYLMADPAMLLKNLAYGRNNCSLDLHLPPSHRRTKSPTKPLIKPVVVFIYGGSWSSGDKSMYGALCGQLASHLGVLVCCPNYSTYPQGCVDDMIQDVVDCIQWIRDNIHEYSGDKDRLMLLGHSAGAHLCVMAMLELKLDQRMYSIQHNLNSSSAGAVASASIHFLDSHYGHLRTDPFPHDEDALEDSSGSSESFAVVSENGNGERNVAGCIGTSLNNSLASSITNGAGMTDMNFSFQESMTLELSQVETDSVAIEYSKMALSGVDSLSSEKACDRPTGADGDKAKDKGDIIAEDDSGEEEDDNDSVVTVRPKEIERHATLIELSSSIKAFIGLAGVYHIGDHYRHETLRSVEDISCMTPAMYGPDHFERFSPTTILQGLDAISLPRIVLVHGTADYVVPTTSSQKLADALARVSADVSLRLLPNCDHYDICFDLMVPTRQFHDLLMTLVLDTANTVF